MEWSCSSPSTEEMRCACVRVSDRICTFLNEMRKKTCGETEGQF